MSNRVLVFSFLIILILLVYCTAICRAQNSSLCSSSSCGDIIISYPFRLRSDPANCGFADPIFALECQENRTIMHSNTSRYHVQAITYGNFSIRLSNPGLDGQNYSSCPVYSSSDPDLNSINVYSISSDSIYVTFLNCLSPVNNPLYIENPFCGNKSAFSNSSRIHSYLTVERILVSDLEESCTYDTTVQAFSPWPLNDKNNYTYSEIHDLMAYGFELSWFNTMCTECHKKKSSCFLEDNKVRCRNVCYEDTPLSERNFICKLEYYAPYIMLAILVVVGLIGLRFVFGLPFLIGLVVYKMKRRDSSMNESETMEELSRHQMSLMPINYSYGEIKMMTRNFEDKLGEGTHGTVFKGKLRSGPLVAVKMLTNSSTGNVKEFISHLSVVSRISHPNIAKLIGFCVKDTKRFMVHEFIPDGSLEKHVFSHEGMKIKPSLSYRDMFKISLGIARGIACLHDIQIMHLNIKPQNILLDRDFAPKISDCGLPKLWSSVEALKPGKMGFIAPELLYRNIGEISLRADVYSFGMMVLEMAARLESLNPCAKNPGNMYFPCWIYKQLSEGKELEMRNAEEEERKMVKKMVLVGLWCIQIKAGNRPLMNEAVAMLEGETEQLHMPPMPFQRAMEDHF